MQSMPYPSPPQHAPATADPQNGTALTFQTRTAVPMASIKVRAVPFFQLSGYVASPFEDDN